MLATILQRRRPTEPVSVTRLSSNARGPLRPLYSLSASTKTVRISSFSSRKSARLSSDVQASEMRATTLDSSAPGKDDEFEATAGQEDGRLAALQPGEEMVHQQVGFAGAQFAHEQQRLLARRQEGRDVAALLRRDEQLLDIDGPDGGARRLRRHGAVRVVAIDVEQGREMIARDAPQRRLHLAPAQPLLVAQAHLVDQAAIAIAEIAHLAQQPVGLGVARVGRPEAVARPAEIGEQELAHRLEILLQDEQKLVVEPERIGLGLTGAQAVGDEEGREVEIVARRQQRGAALPHRLVAGDEIHAVGKQRIFLELPFRADAVARLAWAVDAGEVEGLHVHFGGADLRGGHEVERERATGPAQHVDHVEKDPGDQVADRADGLGRQPVDQPAMGQPVADLLQEQHSGVEPFGKDVAERGMVGRHQGLEQKVRPDGLALRELAEQLQQGREKQVLDGFALALDAVLHVEGVVVAQRPGHFLRHVAAQHVVIDPSQGGDEDERQEMDDLPPAGLDLQRRRPEAQPQPALGGRPARIARGRAAPCRQGVFELDREIVRPGRELAGEGRGKEIAPGGHDLVRAGGRLGARPEPGAAKDRIHDAHEPQHLLVVGRRQDRAGFLVVGKLHQKFDRIIWKEPRGPPRITAR